MHKKTVQKITIGVLALQGDFAEHKEILNQLKVQTREVRTIQDLENIHGLVIPGGESTSIGKQLRETGLDKTLVRLAKKGMPVLGTCAGAILLSNKVSRSHEFKLGLIDATLERNAYGRQNDSFMCTVKIKSMGKVRAVFIRAPKIKKWGKQVKSLAKVGKNVVLAEQKNILIATFHPEITGEAKIHAYFVRKAQEYAKPGTANI